MDNRRWWIYAAATAALAAATVGIKLAMGRVLICECGYVKVCFSSENSQHLSDW
jgi:hypothetical protein